MIQKDKGKMAWVKGLKVGDLVEDCRCLTLKIISIKDEFQPKIPRWVVWVPMPVKLFDWLMDHYDKNAPQVLVDREVTLEGNYICSALHCLDEPFSSFP